jgi:hypothetical protein
VTFDFFGPRHLVVSGAEPFPHLIPVDGAPHAPTTECGCDPQLVAFPAENPAAPARPAFVHFSDPVHITDPAELAPGPGSAQESAAA